MAAILEEHLLIAREGSRCDRAGFEVDRVRCVLKHDHHYLLVQPSSRRQQSAVWALPGGRLKAREKPRRGLRRELAEELRLEVVPYLCRIGDWRHRDECHRVFGCEIWERTDWFNADEIAATRWFTYADVTTLARTTRLHRGFELAAIQAFENRHRS
ncbi:MAG TPA: NUDIX hydrolase [Gammaproteobacteria bacterium]|nr:NUDIX hydrolase [Gammaproteobacteria bacterium]